MRNEQQKTMSTFGGKLTKLRNSLELSQTDIAVSAGISTGYYSAIESDSRLPPPSDTLTRILIALQCTTTDAEGLKVMAACERGLSPFEVNLPLEVQRLLAEIRKRGHTLPTRFTQALRTHIREASN